jgi:hypothetical protein
MLLGVMMKVLITFKIQKGFNAWLKMADEIKPIMEEMGIKMHWSGTNPEETIVYDLLEIKNPEDAQGFAQRKDIAKARSEAGVKIESIKTLSTIYREKNW